MFIGHYEYLDGSMKRIVKEIQSIEENYNNQPILETEEDVQNWLNWKIEDKFWERVW